MTKNLMIDKSYNIDIIRLKVLNFLIPLGYFASILLIDNDMIIIEPDTTKTGNNRPDYFDGLQIIYFFHEKYYEVSEYQAGENADRLFIYKETPHLYLALKDLIKGNKRNPIKIY
jgi:hypothetical protein